MYCSTTFFMCQSNLSAIRRDVRQNLNLAETSVRLHMGNFIMCGENMRKLSV